LTKILRYQASVWCTMVHHHLSVSPAPADPSEKKKDKSKIQLYPTAFAVVTTAPLFE
jgi:hypothetical protein